MIGYSFDTMKVRKQISEFQGSTLNTRDENNHHTQNGVFEEADKDCEEK